MTENPPSHTPSRSTRRSIALFSLLAAVVLFVAVNAIADRVLRSERIDLTSGRLFTLSQGSLNTLAKIDEPITLRFYYSQKLGDEIPSYGIYANRVREMLQEYAALAHGKLELQILDPQPFSPTEDRAVAFGLQGVPLDQGGEQVYFGLAATNSTDDQQVIPFFQPERESFLEYDLTKLIHSLAFPKKPVVGLISNLPLEGDVMAAMQGGRMVPYVVLDQLRQLYDVHTLGGDLDKIPDDVDVLMLVHPQNPSEKTLYAIDQFVLKGGRALVFVDPDSETQQMHPSQLYPPGRPAGSNLEKLFPAWGIEMDPKVVAGDRRAARRVNAGTSARVKPADYVAWLALKKANLNPTDPITADLSTVTMATAGILKKREGAKTTLEPLIQTSPDSMAIPVEKVQGLPDVEGLLRDFKSGGQPLVLAALVTGPAATAFPDGPPQDKAKDDAAKGDAAQDAQGETRGREGGAPKAADAKDAPPPLKASVKDINVVVVADTDILDDRFWVQAQDFFGQRVVIPVANNGDFVVNAVDKLAGGDDLIALRSRGTSARPFERVDNIQRAAAEANQQQASALETKLKDTESKLRELQGKGGKVTTASVDKEQAQAIESFRSEMIKIRQQLRQVQLAMRQDINGLKARLEFFDIAAVPILVGFAAVIIGLVRMQRRKRRAQAA